jgi:hypothetical protein
LLFFQAFVNGRWRLNVGNLLHQTITKNKDEQF